MQTRSVLAAVLVALSAVAALSVTAAAKPASAGASSRGAEWCSDSNSSGTRNCGYHTLSQCRASISGAGGMCLRNPLL